MSSSDAQANIARIIEKYGGHAAFFAAMDERIAAFDRVWNQDTDRIGRVLRAHLAVEHFVTEFLSFQNPNLGSLERARLSYSQKLDLLDPMDRRVKSILPGLRLLGAIRNRASHRLRVELTKADEGGFLGVESYYYMRKEQHKRWPVAPISDEVESALTILEDFARFAAGLLHTSLDPHSHIWAEVLGQDDATAQQTE
jgi:hypothetical protein